MARLEDKIEKAILPLTEMYSQIEMDLLIKLARHFSINEEFINSDYWRIKKLDEMGLFNSEVIDYIARYSSKTNEEVLKALEKIGAETVNFDKLNHLFEDEDLKVDPIVLKDNYTIRNIINFAYNELSNRFIEMSSKIEQSTRDAYLNVVEQAYLKTSKGTHSYQEAIRSAVDELGNKGITTLTYTTKDEDGNIVGLRGYDITSTVRREVLTATRQLSNNISMEVAEELECEYLYLSEHIRCRPEHFDWQGTIIKKEDLVPVTDYGSITGLAGINCAHYFEPYFGDARGDDLKQISKEDATQQYELSQKQRYLERGVRKWKRKKEMFKAIDDKEKYNESKFKVKEWQQRLNKFTEDNNLRRDYTREHVYENKDIKVSNYKDVTQEWLDNATPNSHIVKDAEYFTADDGTKYHVDGKNVVLDYSDNEKEVAEWLENTLGGEIYMVPRVNNPEGISTPDYIFRSENWDLKTIKGSGKQTLYHSVYKKINQSNNFIFDASSSELNIDELKKQIFKLYKREDTKFIEKVILKKHKDMFVYKRK